MVIAHQYKIRLQKAKEKQYTLFPLDYSKMDLDLRKTTIKPISHKTAEVIILEYEWLGTMPHAGSVQGCYGIYFKDICG